MGVQTKPLAQTVEVSNGKYLSKESQSETEKKEKHERCITKIQIIWVFVSFVISAMDVFVIIYLSYLHFHHSSDLVAWLMLAPILLNFIGMYTFLSNDNERKEMENLAGRRLKNLMFFPVIGPAFSQLRLFFYTLEQPNAEHTERLESLLTRMKQYESFFRAAPEAFIQITFRIISWTNGKKFYAEDHWTSACIMLCIYTLAEANMYSPVISYYQMFHYDPQEVKEEKWKVNGCPYNWRVGLFFFSYSSIGARIFADAIFKATAGFYFSSLSFAEVAIMAFLFQFFLRAATYALFNSIASHQRKVKVLEEGVYGAFTYAWKSLFMSFDFASNTKTIFFWFYIETLIMIGSSYLVIYIFGIDLTDKIIYHVYAAAALINSAFAIGLKTWLWYMWDKRMERLGNNKKVADVSVSVLPRVHG